MSTTSTAPSQDTGPEARGGRLGRIVRSPLGWMLTGLVGVGLVSGLTATGPGPVPALGAVAAVAVYWLVMRRVARRETPEISRWGAGREALLGGAIGLGFVLVSTLLITAFGGYSFSWADHGFMAVVWSAVMVQIGAAVTEELLFRGFALQALEQMWGSRAAIVITGLFFGIVHLGAPGANAWSALAIALEAGVMLGAAFLWRRSIWFVVGLHFAWNTTEQLLGIPVSGHSSDGLFTVDVHGSTALSGGGFGLEAALVSVVIGVLLAVRMFVLARRGGRLLPRRQAG
ncbi:CPBP family intramembrane glutamic endopeptidase [Actinomadura sp. NEAU-AAG7]|uniref:CPBP family intramembrane glutamic endopeptidase n=1 Tax=Actinomadura sp. NEAU-AAG7 TaxID=2839640 RepID=UPI001BE41BF0|nr:CPBP family intramembrane glutamic endopeptidase [Actinomadura sp. NEAU-AAG7]MBT2210553.1 CPBP family intramembrane metalloprotease [Actinomadura sp. NEAU-AAG7]